MSPTEVRRQAQKRLRALSPERLRVADDFLAYLEERESDEATAELLALPGFREALHSTEREIERGELIALEDLLSR